MLLRRAHDLLAAGRASEALAALDEHARVYPGGVLAEEREAERIAAVCARGDGTKARELTGAFAAAHPRSALLPRVRRTCAER